MHTAPEDPGDLTACGRNEKSAFVTSEHPLIATVRRATAAPDDDGVEDAVTAAAPTVLAVGAAGVDREPPAAPAAGVPSVAPQADTAATARAATVAPIARDAFIGDSPQEGGLVSDQDGSWPWRDSGPHR
jgi:hypothetical protein